MSGTEWTLTAAVIAGAAILGVIGPRACRNLRAAILRARWAWHCHGKPVRPDGDRLTFDETKTLGSIVSGRKRTARPERTRT